MSDTSAPASAGRFVGQAVLRKEDPRLLTGRRPLHGRRHAARDAARALRAQRRRPGEDHASTCRRPARPKASWRCSPPPTSTTRSSGRCYPSMFHGAEDFMAPIFPLAVDDVRFVGDPIVLIIAHSRYLAEDAAELIEIDYDDIVDPVMSYDRALRRRRQLGAPGPSRQRAHADGGADVGRGQGRRRGRGRTSSRSRSSSTATAWCRWSAAPSSRGGSRSTSASTSGCRARTRTRSASSCRARPACPRTRSACRSATSAAASD